MGYGELIGPSEHMNQDPFSSTKNPLNKGTLSVFGRFIEAEGLRNLTNWEKFKNRSLIFFKRQNRVE
jgi:hypothetical protein